MKTLIWNGSPRKNGDTVSLLEQTVNKLDGEYKIVNAYFVRYHRAWIAVSAGQKQDVPYRMKCRKYMITYRNAIIFYWRLPFIFRN